MNEAKPKMSTEINEKREQLIGWKGKGIMDNLPPINADFIGAILNEKGECIAHVAKEYRDVLIGNSRSIYGQDKKSS